jgi:chemotaxis signal transduction protein/ABC-type nitrate/sulfonate/bicarbonate transport system substrate-binding protein/AmiR/NasT family two-component response regulator
MDIDKKMKILLAEDGTTMRKMEVKILQQIGYENIIEAVDGAQAMEKLESESDIKLVISDWNMPNKSGMDVLAWMRQNPLLKDTGFLMATGQGDKIYVKQAMEAGASGVVAKPFSPDELKNKIEEIFGEKKEAPAKPVERASEKTSDGRRVLKIAHIQITDHLALGVLKHQIETGQVKPHTFSLQTQCMMTWNLVQDALERGQVDAACILAPIAMDLFNYGVPIRLVLFAHRNGSIMVRNKVMDYRKPYQQFFKHKVFFIPHRMSIHNMLAFKYFSEMGLKPGVVGAGAVNMVFEVCAPVNMPSFLAETPNACGFMVAEPIGSRAIAAGIAEKQLISSEIWDHHPCCVVVFREDFIQRNTDAVHEFTRMLVDAGKFIVKHPQASADIAVSFLDPEKKIGLDSSLLHRVLTDPNGITTNNLYPVMEDLDIIQRFMKDQMSIGEIIDLEKFVDPRFADDACKTEAVAEDQGKVVAQISTEGEVAVRPKPAAKIGLKDKILIESSREGKYIIFKLAEERYGIPVLDVREIIHMQPIRSMPQMPEYVKGVINLRGKVIPIVDLRLKLGMESIEYHDRMCIIVVDVASHAGSARIGMITDAVLAVADIKEAIIENTPSFGTKVSTNIITGMAKMTDGVTTLLDIEKILSGV